MGDQYPLPCCAHFRFPKCVQQGRGYRWPLLAPGRLFPSSLFLNLTLVSHLLTFSFPCFLFPFPPFHVPSIFILNSFYLVLLFFCLTPPNNFSCLTCRLYLFVLCEPGKCLLLSHSFLIRFRGAFLIIARAIYLRLSLKHKRNFFPLPFVIQRNPAITPISWLSSQHCKPLNYRR